MNRPLLREQPAPILAFSGPGRTVRRPKLDGIPAKQRAAVRAFLQLERGLKPGYAAELVTHLNQLQDRNHGNYISGVMVLLRHAAEKVQEGTCDCRSCRPR